MKTAAEGFTLIELVVTITILGILAAFAYPRFAGLQVEARASTVDSLAGSLRSSSSLAHSLDLVTGNTGSVTMEGSAITLVNGYPNLATIDDTLSDLTGFTYAPGTGLFTKDDATTPANCSVDYDDAGPGGIPAIVVDIAGC